MTTRPSFTLFCNPADHLDICTSKVPMIRSDVLEHPVWGHGFSYRVRPPVPNGLTLKNGTDRLIFILIGSLDTTDYVQVLRI
jgi:hypothetical protein